MGGNIQKTGGRWRIDYRDGQGRRHRATFDTRKEADNALTDIKSRIGKGEYVASKLLPRFRELAEDWYVSKGDRRPERSVTGALRSICISIRNWAIFASIGSTSC